MKRALIAVDELKKYMKDDYYDFIEYLKKKNKIDEENPIWIIAEWSE